MNFERFTWFLLLLLCLATANIANVYLMRQNELQTGIDVEDDKGNIVGTSKAAAKKVKSVEKNIRWI